MTEVDLHPLLGQVKSFEKNEGRFTRIVVDLVHLSPKRQAYCQYQCHPSAPKYSDGGCRPERRRDARKHGGAYRPRTPLAPTNQGDSLVSKSLPSPDRPRAAASHDRRDSRRPAHYWQPVSTSNVARHPRIVAAPGWRIAIYVSVVLWVATVAGNVALYAMHPATHWPLLESVETLQVASLVPVALLLHRLNYRSVLCLFITVMGVGGMLAGVLIDIGFATGLVSFAEGPIGGPAFYISEGLVLLWLLAINMLALRFNTLERGLALLGIGSALTATLLYPVWAIRLSRALQPV